VSVTGATVPSTARRVEDAIRATRGYDGLMSESAASGAAAPRPRTPESNVDEPDHGNSARSSRTDPRKGGHAEDAPASLHAVELVADDEPIASNDEWDDPDRL